METEDKKQLWHDCLESIKISVSSPVFKTWFTQTHLSEVKKGEGRFFAEVGCSTSFVRSTVEDRYFGLIQDSLAKSLGNPIDLTFIVKENPDKIKLSEEKTSTPLFADQKNSNELLRVLSTARIRPGFTFDNFAVSGSNQMAWAAADAVSKNPGSAYNPLFIWGGVGIGKSHLMIAIGHKLLSLNQNMKVYFTTSEEFTNDIIEGIRNKTTPAVRNRYRKLDLLMIDDIQFIAGKDTAQEEFFHTFNAVTTAGGQVILTSDKPPSEISKLEERLKSRFEAGLIVDISPPDFELRCAITQIKAKERGMDLGMNIIQVIAGNIETPRKIQGFLVRLQSELLTKQVEMSEDFVTSLFKKEGEGNGEKELRTSPEQVINAVSRYFSLGKRKLMSTSRRRPLAQPRQILMYLLRIQLKLPLEEVGRVVGRDHTTVMHAVDKITNLASQDVKISEDILGIKKILWG